MNILKKAVSCFAAAAVMTSMAVTASATIPHMSVENDNDGNHFIQIGSFPSEMDAYDEVLAYISFGDQEIYDKQLLVIINKNADKNAIQAECLYASRADNTWSVKYGCTCGRNDFGILVEIGIPKDSEEFVEISQFEYMGVAFVGVTTDDNGKKILHYYSYEKEAMDDDNKLDSVDYTWFNGWKDKASELLPEPTSSEPVSEPESEPVSEPADEPTSSEPVSEPESSEPTTSQPSNVDTGTAGVAAVIGTALLAAGAVIVTRKKNK